MTLGWPIVAALGFLALAGLDIALARGSTARYEFERNRARGRSQPAPAPAATGAPAVAASPGRPGTRTSPQPVGGAAAGEGSVLTAAVAVSTHPAGRRAPGTASPSAWWLLDASADEHGRLVVAGPFDDRLDADWAALACGLPDSVLPVYGVRRDGAAFVRRQPPQEGEWLAELGSQLDRLPEDWNALLSDTDPLTTLAVEVAAGLVEAGLPLHDGAGDAPSGGVCLTPAPDLGGILVSWRQHDRMSLQQVRGPAADVGVQETMNTAVADVLAELGFPVQRLTSMGCHLVTAPQ